MYTEKQTKVLDYMLIEIIQAKEKLCEYVQSNGLGCSKCPLNVEDKCTELNLKEFNYKDYKWIDKE